MMESYMESDYAVMPCPESAARAALAQFAIPTRIAIQLAPPETIEGIGGCVIESLAKLSGKTMLDQTALSHALGVTTRTTRRLVARNELPPGVKMGARRVWFVEAVLAHVQRRAERAEREAERGARRIDKWREL